MGIYRTSKRLLSVLLIGTLLLYLSACQSTNAQPPQGATHQAYPTTTPNPSPTMQGNAINVKQHVAPTAVTATPQPSPTAKATASNNPPPPQSGSGGSSTSRPLLAFYYMWYNTASWCICHMSDLPATQYNSSDDATIDRQLTEAANAGITGFISSWWGAGDQTDSNFAKLLAHAASLESRTGYHFASTLYFESDAPALSGTTNAINSLRYITAHYVNDPHFFHWQGKPVLFFWNPLGNGRTLAQWAAIRSQVDPNNQMIWSAEGVDTSLLSVFDGIHLFSGGYWGILNNTMPTVDQGFRTKLDAYNTTNHTHKIWAAGVLPGYNDTRIQGRTGTYIVPRNNGSTYINSWSAALSSNPDWITITSFNEWFEGAMIEPSVTYGAQYLTLTQQYAKQWHG